MVAELGQDHGAVGTDLVIVLNQQDRLAGAGSRHRHLGRIGGTRRPAVVAREIELDRRPVPRLAIEGDVAARLLDEAIDLAEAETGAAADILGGEERLEGARHRLLRHARARVTDGDIGVLAGNDLAVGGGIGLVERRIAGLDGQLAAVGHGVARIDRQVEDGAFELVLVDLDRPQARRQYAFELDLLAECPV